MSKKVNRGWVDYAPGVVRASAEDYRLRDHFRGSTAALVAAGLVQEGWLPGQPGCGLVQQRVSAAGALLPGNVREQNAGTRTIRRAGHGDQFDVFIEVDDDEYERRAAARRAQRAEQSEAEPLQQVVVATREASYCAALPVMPAQRMSRPLLAGIPEADVFGPKRTVESDEDYLDRQRLQWTLEHGPVRLDDARRELIVEIEERLDELRALLFGGELVGSYRFAPPLDEEDREDLDDAFSAIAKAAEAARGHCDIELRTRILAYRAGRAAREDSGVQAFIARLHGGRDGR